MVLNIEKFILSVIIFKISEERNYGKKRCTSGKI